jgi:hypothetical protein
MSLQRGGSLRYGETDIAPGAQTVRRGMAGRDTSRGPPTGSGHFSHTSNV